MLGKLTIDALPFYSWVAMGGALVTVVARSPSSRELPGSDSGAICGANG